MKSAIASLIVILGVVFLLGITPASAESTAKIAVGRVASAASWSLGVAQKVVSWAADEAR